MKLFIAFIITLASLSGYAQANSKVICTAFCVKNHFTAIPVLAVGKTKKEATEKLLTKCAASRQSPVFKFIVYSLSVSSHNDGDISFGYSDIGEAF